MRFTEKAFVISRWGIDFHLDFLHLFVQEIAGKAGSSGIDFLTASKNDGKEMRIIFWKIVPEKPFK